MPNEEKIIIRDLRRKEKFFIDDEYLNGYAKKCGVTATAVYASLCRHVDKKQKCYPSTRKIAEEHNISIRSVYRALDVLEQYLIIRRKRLGKQLTNRYYLLDRTEWSDVPKMTYHTCQKQHITDDKNDISIVRKHKSNETQKKGGLSFKELADAYKKGERNYKPFFWGDEMRWSQNRWWVIENGEWFEFAGNESEIEWR